MRGRNPLEPTEDLSFCITEWNVENIRRQISEKKNETLFLIKIYGCTEKGESICLNVEGFKPYFYIEIPKTWTKPQAKDFLRNIFGQIEQDCTRKTQYFPKEINQVIDKITVISRKKFYGFTNNELFKFIKLPFKNTFHYDKIKRKIAEIKFRSFRNYKLTPEALFETNIPPFFRFIHEQNITPAGWIKVNSEDYTFPDLKENRCQIEITTNYKSVQPVKNEKTAPLIIASYDIECDSSHGDFPQAKKDYKKLANELISMHRDNPLTREKLTECLIQAFNQEEIEKDGISKLFTKKGLLPSEQLIEDTVNKLMFYIENTESYGIIEKELNIFLKKKRSVKEIKQALESCFREDANLKSDKFMLSKMYTKLNKKPYNNKLWYIAKKIKEGANWINQLLESNLPEIDTSYDTLIARFNDTMQKYFPGLEGDKVIQIGTVVMPYGSNECSLNHIITLKSCDPIENTVIESYETEREVLMAWRRFIADELDPDIITGYNIFGFDYKYMVQRAEELDISEEFRNIGRIEEKTCDMEIKKLSSSALGENKLEFINMDGRIQMDLFKIVQRDHNLVSYKLDYVAETFINDSVEESEGNRILAKNSNNQLEEGNFITLHTNQESKYKDIKFKIIKKDGDNLWLDKEVDLVGKYKWQLAKDDVSPNDIFTFQKKSSMHRAIIAKYCIQDCRLCLRLINKLQIITNNIAMANVCFVPLSFIFLRGQGVKILSLVSKQCKKENFLLPVISKQKDNDDFEKKSHEFNFEYSQYDNGNNSDSYEGAIVLKPTPGIYMDKYIVVLDYASLYPSSMISENLSHDSICLDEKYLGDEGAHLLETMGYGYEDITHNVYQWQKATPTAKTYNKVKVGTKTCRFVQPPEGKKSIIPRILQDLLGARKATKKRMKAEKDSFKKSILDGLQLAFKVTANSLYGQIGAKTSPICLIDIAASTTATGQKLLNLAKDKTEEQFEGARAIYGDTDSVFIDFSPKKSNGKLIEGKEGLIKAIQMGKEAEEFIQQFLKPPHRLEYEKTFWPFILFSKKRYIGYKYEEDPDKYKETSMGIVLKRRDNANIVKHVYGNVINNLLTKKDINLSIKMLRSQLTDLLNGKFPLEMLIISKSLRGFYKNPKQIAHKVLADRMGERDPGNKPMVNDRIPYVYVQTKTKSKLQGDRIEHPDFLREQGLNPDYLFYITNQIMKPVGQIYALIADKLVKTDYDSKHEYLLTKYEEQKASEKLNDLKFKEVCNYVFGEILRKAKNKKEGKREITDFFGRKK